MQNVVYNGSVVQSNYIMPYAASRAVDGSISPLRRWLARVPAAMIIDLHQTYWVDRWVCYHMSQAGWSIPDYSNQAYKLYGSLNGATWFQMDAVTGNTASLTDRTFEACECRYVKLQVNVGLVCNPQLAGVVEFALFEAEVSSSKLQNLTVSEGLLTPIFNTNTLVYTVSVEENIQFFTVTPTSIDGGTIKVNGTAVASGEESQAIPLNIGVNEIVVEVTSSIGGVVTNYAVIVNRVLDLNLSSLGLLYSGRGFSETHTVSMTSSVLNYTDSVGSKAANVKITPQAANASNSISVNGQMILSGQESDPIALQTGENQISIVVSRTGFAETKTYELKITKAV